MSCSCCDSGSFQGGGTNDSCSNCGHPHKYHEKYDCCHSYSEIHYNIKPDYAPKLDEMK